MDSHKPPGSTGLHRLLTRANLRAALPYLAIGLLLVLAILLFGRELELHIGEIESRIARLGIWGVLVFVVLFVLASSILIPDTVLCFLAGALFGVGWGAIAVLGGNLLACALQYALARRLLRVRIARTLAAKPSLAVIQRAVAQDELRLQVLLRLTPLNPATISYLLGAAGVRFVGFLVACLAHSPNLVIEVYFGHAGRHLAGMAGGGTNTLHDLAIIGGVVVCMIVLILVSRTVRKALARAVSATDDGTVDRGPD